MFNTCPATFVTLVAAFDACGVISVASPCANTLLVINNVDIKNVKTYLFGENKQNLSKILNKDIFDIQLFPSLEEIIKAIYKENLRKKIILFSPSSPSFDQYRSFEERGKAFKELINLYDKT